ncbi:hypothetical protein DPMN_131107 [Dreissena polymorpha]|uniref:Sushi domain-containing protein n=2 Tax=Dreissena polymorpha TaxID=45954 RepID=A0A9D4H411_DREPO|nr:hypothetical protein DPMN_131107 [Dreissena polymorpha]
MVGEDIRRCVKECARKPWCQYLGYRRHFPLCNLYIEPYDEALKFSRTDCVIVLKSAMQSEMITECNNVCPVSVTSLLTCNVTSLGISCIKEECPPPEHVPYAKEVLGNMNTNGSKKLVSCLPGYKIEGEKIIICNDGHWTPLPACIIEEQWVSNVRNFSSQAVSAKDPESIAWNAVQVMGPPDVYPKHEQNPLAWSVSPANVKSTEEFLELEFAIPVKVGHVDIYETYKAGSVTSIQGLRLSDDVWVTLWSTDTPEEINTSRIFSPPLKVTSFFTNIIRINMDATLSSDYIEVDAVKLITA